MKNSVEMMLKLALASLVVLCTAQCNMPLAGPKPPSAKDFFSGRQQLALVGAIESANLAKIEGAISDGADANGTGSTGMTPLMWAVLKHQLESFKYLLDHGADPNLTAKDGDSAVSYAAIAEDPAYLELVATHDGDLDIVNPETGRTPIYDAVMFFRVENVRTFVDNGAHLDFRNRHGNTPMMTAAALNRYDMVYLLLIGGADPTIEDNWGNDLTYFLRRPSKPNSDSFLFEWYEKVVALMEKRGQRAE